MCNDMKIPEIPIIRTYSVYKKYFREYGIPQACTKHVKNIFKHNIPVLFKDDFDDGKPVAIAFSRKLMKNDLQGSKL